MSNQAVVREINAAINAHGAWKAKLKSAIDLGKSDTSPDDIKCDDKCAFGKWLYNPSLPSSVRDGMPYQVVRRLHAEFHNCASGVLGHALSGHRQDAADVLQGEFTQRSEVLVVALNKWKRELEAA
jgi:hypothetical protein